MSNEYNKTTDEIREELLGYLPNLYEKTVGTAIWDFCQSVALGFKKLLDSINTVLGMHDVHNLTGLPLRKYVKQRTGIDYKSATFASDFLTLTGDFSVASGTMFLSGGGIAYLSQGNIDSVDGTAQVPIVCQVAGSVGNVAVGAISKSVSTIAGVTSITNANAITNGYDDESDASLLQRYDIFMALPLTSGNKYHYLKWALDVIGVGLARVFPLWNGNNTVKVVIVNSNFEPASNDLVASVQQYIDPDISGRGEGQAPCGAYCTVVSASALNLNIAGTYVLESGISEAEAIVNITAAIKDYLKSIAFSQTYVSYARIAACVLGAEGVHDHIGLTLNGGTSNLSVTDTQVAVLHSLNLAV